MVFDTTNACAHALAYWKGKVNAPASGTMIDNLAAFLSQQLGSSPSPHSTPTPLPAPLNGPTVVTASSTCTPPPVSGVTYTANMSYGHDFNEPLYADTYRPSGSTGVLPTVVLIHDGGFDAGDKCDADVVAAAVQLARNGYEAVSANYPLATPTQATFPNPVYDVFKGIATLRADAGALKIDPNRIAVWGAGAGANIALTAALDAPFIAPASRVQAVVSYSGDTDAFEVMGEYKLAGAAESDVNWPEYVGSPTRSPRAGTQAPTRATPPTRMRRRAWERIHSGEPSARARQSLRSIQVTSPRREIARRHHQGKAANSNSVQVGWG